MINSEDLVRRTEFIDCMIHSWANEQGLPYDKASIQLFDELFANFVYVEIKDTVKNEPLLLYCTEGEN